MLNDCCNKYFFLNEYLTIWHLFLLSIYSVIKYPMRLHCRRAHHIFFPSLFFPNNLILIRYPIIKRISRAVIKGVNQPMRCIPVVHVSLLVPDASAHRSAWGKKRNRQPDCQDQQCNNKSIICPLDKGVFFVIFWRANTKETFHHYTEC